MGPEPKALFIHNAPICCKLASIALNGDYEYVGVDWNTGQIKARWPFQDDSRKWNAYGGITALLEDGDLMIGGAFAIKRLNIGDGN